MIERELKFRVGSHEPIRRRLQEAGATFLSRGIEWNQIFDRPDGRFRAAGCGLRIREFRPVDGGNSVTTLTFKGPVMTGAVKTREEIEFQVSDARAAEAFFQRLGFVPILQYEKRRESWKLGDCRVELDEPAAIGLFVEVEGPSDSAVEDARRRLGLLHESSEPNSYVGMLVNYCDQRRIEDRVLKFSSEHD